MKERTTVYLKDLATGEPVAAELIDGLTLNDVMLAESSWCPFIQSAIERLAEQKVPREQWPQHLHWTWRRKFKKTSRFLAYHWLGLQCGGQMQGLMLLDTVTATCRLPEQLGKPLVYGHYLATAPWNSPELTQQPRYGWIGRIFIAAAISLSLKQGFKGRLGLHSLPQSERYYTNVCGMVDMGTDVGRHNLRYFEFTEAQAIRFLE